jgi:hypothetical protein
MIFQLKKSKDRTIALILFYLFFITGRTVSDRGMSNLKKIKKQKNKKIEK